MNPSPLILLLLALVAFLAAFVDAIAGGGGLLTLPALTLAGLPPYQVLGTNKGQSVFGSGMALLRYAGSPLLDRRRIRTPLAFGLLGGFTGVLLVTLINPDSLKLLIAILLTAVALFMIFYRTPKNHGPKRSRPLAVAALIAFLIATYDGFFGPGTGTFLIIAYVLAYHEPLDEASANAKVVNFASNLSSLALFSLKGHILWKVALPMAAGQALGGYLGAHTTIRHGRHLVRWTVVLISLALVTKLLYQLFH